MRVLFWLIVALLSLFTFVYIGEERTLRFEGSVIATVAGAILLVTFAVMLFNRVQALLLARGLIARKVTTPYDIFPVILLVPLVLSFTFESGEPPGQAGYWVLGWGGHDKLFVFMSILGLIYLYRIVRLLDLVVANQRAHAKIGAPHE